MSEPLGNAGSALHVDWQAELDRHRRWLRTVVLARAGEPQAVDEIMQEVALAAVTQKSPIRDVARIAPWLYQLAVRQSLMYRRKLGRKRRLEKRYAERAGGLTPPTQSLDPLTWLLADERRQLIRQALRRLKRPDAEILLLKYTEDWSYQDIAEHLGIGHSAVESRLHRARQRLRDELTALNVIETPA